MSESHGLVRKDFLKLTLALAGSSAAVWLVGCSDGEVPPAPDEPGGGKAGSAGSSGAAGKAGSGGAGGGSAGTVGGGSGTAGTAGSTNGAGTAGSGGASGAGAGSFGAGGSATGGGGVGGAGGAGGNAGGGMAGVAGGPGGAGSGGLAGGASGASGAAGGSAAGSGGTGGGCSTLTFAQNTNCMPKACQMHDHVPDNATAKAAFFEDLLAHIMGPDALMPYSLPNEGQVSHSHFLTFTQQELDTLRSGGTLMAKTPDPDDKNEIHIYTIGCS